MINNFLRLLIGLIIKILSLFVDFRLHAKFDLGPIGTIYFISPQIWNSICTGYSRNISTHLDGQTDHNNAHIDNSQYPELCSSIE